MLFNVCIVQAKELPGQFETPAQREINKLNEQVYKLYGQGKFQEALPLAKKSVKISERNLGGNHPKTATNLNNLAELYRNLGVYKMAEQLHQRVLTIRENTLGAKHLITAASLNNLCLVYMNTGEFKKAEQLCQRALTIRKKELGLVHPDTVNSLALFTKIYVQMGNFSKAVPLYQDALSVKEKALGVENPEIAISLTDLAALYEAMDAYTKAEPLYQRALAVREKALGPEHRDTAASLNNLASLYLEMRAFSKAEPLLLRSLTIIEKTRGSENPDTAANLNNLASLYNGMGAYAKAEPIYQRALAIREKALGLEHQDTAASLNNLASLYLEMGAFDKAEPLFLRSLAINEKVLGSEHLITGASMGFLATLYEDMGSYDKAESFYQRALAINEKKLEPVPNKIAGSLNNLALFYSNIGSYHKAEPLFQRALSISEKALGPEHPNTALSLNNLALLYHHLGFYNKAEPLYQRALAINEMALGPEHPTTATSLNNLAGLYYAMGAYGKAEPFYQRALAIKEKALGPDHPDTANSLNNLALLYYAMGAYGKAEPLYQRALAIYDKALGPEHENTAKSLTNLGVLNWEEGRWPDVVDAWQRAFKIEELNAQRILVLGDEARKKAYIDTLGYNHAVTFSLAAQQHIKNSPALGLEVVLQRKGRVLEAMTDSIGLLRQHLTPADQGLLDQLAAIRSQQAALLFSKPAKIEPAVYQAQVAKLNTNAEELENKLSARSAEFKIQHQIVTLERVQAALPKGSALVELVVYSPFNPKAKKPDEEWGTPHYMAYVLHPSGEPKGIVLGEVKELDALIDNWRKALSNPRDSSVRRGVKVANSDEKSSGTVNAGQQLYAKLIKPLLPLFDDSKTLFVAPDGDLNLVPLGALPDESGHYLLETHEINYLTSGRDMLKWSLPANIAKQPVVLANPDFGSISKKVKEPELLAANDRGRRSGDYSRGTFHFDPLAGTAEEAKELSKLLTDGTILTGAKATETALKALHSPRILHLATHGFFLPDQPDEKPDSNAGMLNLDGQRPLPPSKNENPLLRSGIALAGANRLQSGNEDGVLTALEASGLDLWGTQLVVLSACETGIGKVSNGEGVYGLRRALVNAGAEAQVMSLWKVDDAATRDLMVDYYKRLLAGAGRAEALRQTQLAMLNSKDRNHPYYWAAFIASGDVRPITQVKP